MVRRRKIRTLNKDRTVFMYTQYTAIREIKDHTVFMYIQYTVKYDPEKWNFMSEANFTIFTILFAGVNVHILS